MTNYMKNKDTEHRKLTTSRLVYDVYVLEITGSVFYCGVGIPPAGTAVLPPSRTSGGWQPASAKGLFSPQESASSTHEHLDYGFPACLDIRK